jgi:hypothetical protein
VRFAGFAHPNVDQAKPGASLLTGRYAAVMAYTCSGEGTDHTVDRMLSFFSSRRNWDSPNPSTAGECALPPVLGGGAHSLAREGLGDSQFRRGDIHWRTLYIGTYFVVQTHYTNLLFFGVIVSL